MKRILTLILLAACIVSASAQRKKYTLNVGDFTELTVADNINIVYKNVPDSAGYARYICEPAVAHAITFSNRKDKLKIELQSDEPLGGTVPTIVLYSASLAKVTNLGDSLVQIIKPAACESFNATVIGNGSIIIEDVYCTRLATAVEAGHGSLSVNGRAQEAKYTIASVGSIDALDVECNKVKCWMIGTGVISCSVGESLTIYGAGSGTVSYRGKPTIKKRSIGVKLEQLK